MNATAAGQAADDRPWGRAAAAAAADLIRQRTGLRRPVLAVTLGSGLGGFARAIENPRRVPFDQVPGFLPVSVLGHAGEVVVGEVAGRELLAFSGRFHMYEGHAARAAGFPVRVAHALGAPAYLATNATGGLKRSLAPGDLVLIRDHINLSGQNPLTGPAEPGDDRFPDMSSPYSPRLGALLKQAAEQSGAVLNEGVYAGLLGPTYETPSEVRMLATLGADVTGMSTVPEAIVAAALGLDFAAVSLVTNPAAGLSDSPVLHDDVVTAAAKAEAQFAALVTAFVSALPAA
ncbi:MAG: purine-nucleoside phosphorylase [Gemmatimonadetes bacterium]|nr:purine-nucleoside phosphorylase [Gemmatimonadota bacterium]